MRTTYAVGVDVGGTRIAAGLVERKGRILKEARALTPRAGGPFAIVDAIIGLINEVSNGTRASEIAGIGVGLPAQIDFLKQSVEFCTNLPLTGVDVRALVTSRIHQDVVIDNDGHCAGIGESRFGAGKGVRDFVMITLGTGVGGALFLDGQPYRGSRGLGGEIGHIVVRLDGLPCPCGGTGHLEAYIGRPALAAAGRAAAETYRGSSIAAFAGGNVADIAAEHVVQAAQAGDEAALEILLQAGDILGEALVGIVNTLN
ncbi:MAG TPA: ROK family protein, partial [Coriobacteriia bacterium]|nr:ROK family protein [Coriobacteriia bacterium]